MIQKKKFSDAIAANISVVGGLIGNVDTSKSGLLTPTQYMNAGLSMPLDGLFKLGTIDTNFKNIFGTIIACNNDINAILTIAHFTIAGRFPGAFGVKVFIQCTEDEKDYLKFYTDENTKSFFVKGGGGCFANISISSNNNLSKPEKVSIDVSTLTKVTPLYQIMK